jgi:NAD(P)-dependent dehydrogenase (short-subunit alcohol dehydrogenase family)
MRIQGSIALVTGANRGLGRAFAQQLVHRGAARVYAAARRPGTVVDPSLTPIELDITDSERVTEVAEQLTDVTLLVNNAGIQNSSSFIGTPSLEPARQEMETNYFGTLAMCRAFAPVLGANGGGAIVNMLSVSSFVNNPLDPSYGASKAAAWSMTNGIRIELSHQGTLVVAVHSGFIDTDMSSGYDAPKLSPEFVATQAFDAVEAGSIEVLADERSRFVKDFLSHDHELIYPAIQEFWDSLAEGSTKG